MPAPMLLIVSSILTSADLQGSPFNLDPEQFMLTGYEYLGYLGTGNGRFAALVLHEPDPGLLPKLALGIRDGAALESVWNTLAHAPQLPVRVLVPAPCRPLPAWFDLGIEPITPKDLRALLGEAAAGHIAGTAAPASTASSGRHPAPLTADDIRDLNQQGRRTLPADTPMTDWAREVATSLGITLAPKVSQYVLMNLPIRRRADLISRLERMHAAASADPNLYFILPAPYWPALRELAPNLKSRIVAPSVFLATNGAFTGEISLDMIADAGCRGAILPAGKPYADPKLLPAFLKNAARMGLLIFSAAPLERSKGCDIMAPHDGIIPLGTPGVVLIDDAKL